MPICWRHTVTLHLYGMCRDINCFQTTRSMWNRTIFMTEWDFTLCKHFFFRSFVRLYVRLLSLLCEKVDYYEPDGAKNTGRDWRKRGKNIAYTPKSIRSDRIKLNRKMTHTHTYQTESETNEKKNKTDEKEQITTTKNYNNCRCDRT